MAYRFRHQETVDRGLRRVAGEQAEKAIAAVTGHEPFGDRVHDARTCCKKLRGLLRLVRPNLGEAYQVENSFLRDLARSLSAARDAGVVRGTFESLIRGGRLDPEAAAAIRTALPASPSGEEDGRRLDAFADSMRVFRDRIDGWAACPGGFGALKGGLRDVYAGGRNAMREAIADGGDVERHEWRKQVKYHWYHVRLLRDVWAAEMKARGRELGRLSDLLGDDHDLAVLRAAVEAAPALQPGDRDAAFGLIDRRRERLLAEAGPLGARLYAETPRAFARRIRRYWKAWRATTGRPADA